MARYTDSVRARARQLYENTDQPIRSIAAELGIGDNTLQRMKIKDGWARRCERVRGLPVAVQLLEEAKALAATAPIPANSRKSGNPENAQQRASEELGPRFRGDERSESASTPALDAATAPIPAHSRASGNPVIAKQAQAEPHEELDPRLRGDDRPGDGSAIDRLEALVVNAIATEEAAKAQFVGKRRTATVSERSARTLATLTQTLRALRQMRNGDLPDTESLNDDSNDQDDMPRDIDEFRRDLARRIDAFVASRTDSGDVDGDAGSAPLDAAG